MPREIKLDGGEITMLKSIGLSGTQMYGKLLLERSTTWSRPNFSRRSMGLISLGYVISNKVNVRTMEDVERVLFSRQSGLSARFARRDQSVAYARDKSAPAGNVAAELHCGSEAIECAAALAVARGGCQRHALSACFAPFDQAWLCWIALTPLLAAVWFSGANSKRRWLRDLSLGYVAGWRFSGASFRGCKRSPCPAWFLVGALHGNLFRGLGLACRPPASQAAQTKTARGT